MILHSYRGRASGEDPKVSVIEAPGAGQRSLVVVRADESDAVQVSVMGSRGGILGTVEITPEVVSALVQEFVGRGMHLTVAMQERLREDAAKVGS